MEKSGKFKRFGLLIVLSVALVFVGNSFLEGQKDKTPPPERLRVIIPPYGSGYNLYGTNGGIYVDDDINVFVSGNKGLRKHPDYPYYVFILTLCNTHSWGDSCPQEGEYYIPGDYTIGFQGIALNSEPLVNPDPGPICRFPPMTVCGIEQAPYCMGCFLNNREHPSSWACVDGENRGYMGAYIKIKVFDDIWNYPMGEPIPAEMSLYISVYTGRMAHEGEDFYHDLKINIHRPENDPIVEPYLAYVTRLDEDSWNIIFDQIPQDDLVVFEETYDVLLGEVKPKGKSGEYQYEYEERTTMIATADHFSFNISWERY